MKLRYLTLFILITVITFPQKYPGKKTFEDYTELDLNNVKLRNFDYDFSFWRASSSDWILNNYSAHSMIYDHGMCLVGKIDDSVRAGIRQWTYFYSRGPIIDGKPAMQINPQDSSRYRVYKISRGDDTLRADYAEWPFDLGAPQNHEGKPQLYGDQTLWTVYNMNDTSKIRYSPFSKPEQLTIPIEVRETAYTHKSNSELDDDLLSNIVFIEYEFVNKGDKQIDSAYWGFWTDIDLNSYFDNNPLIDITRQLGLCFSFRDFVDSLFYPKVPAALGYNLLYGPLVHSPGSTGMRQGTLVQDSTNLNITSFHPVLDDSFTMPDSPTDTSRYLKLNVMGPIDTHNQAWNVARGLGAFGWPIYDPFNKRITKFPLSGDPETKTGWYAYDNESNGLGGGDGFMFFSGPFDLPPGKSQWVMLAIIPALGENNFDSITKLRAKADELQTLSYESLTKFSSIDSTDNDDDLILDYTLKQNYPNPFNPSTIIEYTIPKESRVKVEVFNLLGQKVATLFNDTKVAGNYSIEWNAVNYSSGVYFYKFTAGSFVETKKMMLVK